MFLDVAADRYFCLGRETEAAWRAALAGTPDPDQVALLERRRLTVSPPCPGAIATASQLDQAATRSADVRRMAALASGIWTARRCLRRDGLAGGLEALRHARRRAARRAPPTGELSQIARDFARLALFITPHNQCLPHSLALATHLAARGHRPELVVGVRMGPFRAHCWVECDGSLVNDRYERVRSYAPIHRA
ncbi:lasso peptide biosynthesis B2 protein [Novosphingobium sp. JCM 18896]|uniref:lasso peptide biosynthesis B2 protein n=1 Tax=Novosphingobium sp. JCM 18896 TaxID=2989731 RepID=UPI002221E63A|nr:lasso peptide biosynthesis B2 protein [Novosphingobium sp. JCM 18896]MCW1430886.1 lasso peptide biosynthesis B2 protein [Novosphingobium sp. JCM 18896]